MLSKTYLSPVKVILFFCLISALPSFLMAGDPIPGIDITVEQSPSGIKKSGTTNSKGELVLAGFKPGRVVVTVRQKDKVAVFGKDAQSRIVLPGSNTRANVKPIRLELSLYSANQNMKKGYDYYQSRSDSRSVPAEKATAKKDNKTLRANHNTTRSNRLAPAIDADSDNDSIPTTKAQNYNSSRSNATSAIEMENDFEKDEIVEILPMAGGKIKMTVERGK